VADEVAFSERLDGLAVALLELLEPAGHRMLGSHGAILSRSAQTSVSHFLSKDFTGYCGLFLHVTSVVVFENESVT
jgi:hypothetical protein